MSYIISVSYIHSADLVGVVVASQMCIDEQIWQLCDPERERVGVVTALIKYNS